MPHAPADLAALAQTAGLAAEWTDYRGIRHAIAPATQQQVLEALGIDCTGAAAIADSRARLLAEAAAPPALAVLRSAEPWTLPAAFGTQPGAAVELVDEAGECVGTRLIADAAGRAALPGLLLDAGYYTLRLDGHAQALALAPAGAPGFARLAGRERGFGFAAQLYGLRRGADGGVGDFSALAEHAAALGAHGASALAISPVHALFAADPQHYSPYSPSNRQFLNYLHADAHAAGLGAEAAACDALGPSVPGTGGDFVDWSGVARARLAALRRLWDALAARLRDGDDALALDYRRFVEAGGEALERHARFELLHGLEFGADLQRWHWRSWPAALQQPDSPEVARLAHAHAHELGFHRFAQWLAARGLAAAQAAARGAGMEIGLITDIAVGTSSGGSAAWSAPGEVFTGLSIGAPPDPLGPTGQTWGLVTHAPQALRSHGYAPFLQLLRAALRSAGGVRIDHILGLRRLWVVPDGENGAGGCYLDYPLDDLLALVALEAHRHRALIVGEDLGTVPPGLHERLAAHGIAGMSVLWFQRDHGLFVEPARWPATALAMTSTHDLPTVAGWWQGRDLDWRTQVGHLEGAELVEAVAGRACDREALWAAFTHAGIAEGPMPEALAPAPVVDAALAYTAATPAALALLPLEDLCGLGEQPNLPGTVHEHPNWCRRLPGTAEALLAEPAVAARLAMLQRLRGAGPAITAAHGEGQAPPAS